MKYTFACKRVPLNDSIKEYAQKKISKLERYFREEDTTAFVTFSVEKDHLCSVEITIRGGATLLRAQTEAPDGDMRGPLLFFTENIFNVFCSEIIIYKINGW